MSAHTPGPWFVVSESVHERGDTLLVSLDVVPDGDYRGTVCSMQSAGHIQGISRAEARANARLIAAAPELLALAQMVVGDFHEDTVYEAAKSAINRAVGEPL